MDNIKQVDVKILAENTGDVKATEFVAVLQRWIREHTIPGVLIDVADYSHIHDGQGVILVGHEFNLSIDYVGGRMGLLFHSKLPPEATFADRVASALKQAFNASAILEEEGEFKARLKFDRARFRFMISDRLFGENTDESYDAIAPVLQKAAAALSGGDAELARVNDDARDRLTVDVALSKEIAATSVA